MVARRDYLEAIRDVLDHLEQTQLPAADRAADLIVESITNGGALFCANIGHGIEGDFLNRAGGLAALQRFSYSFNVNSKTAECLADRPRGEPFNQGLEAVRLAVRASNLRSGEVMMLGPVSGRNAAPVELALACGGMGVKTIGFTSMEYTSRVESRHPSGKRLFEVVDVVVDNGAPYGDAAVKMEGFDFNVLPVSGVAVDVAGWLIFERVMRKMAASGNTPAVFMSVNREGGQEHYEKMIEQFNRRGY